MPAASTILEQLFAIANAHPHLGIAWHVAIVVAAIGLARGLSTRRAAALAILPLISVSLISASHGAWFNAISFGVVAGSTGYAILSHDLAPRWRTAVPRWSTALGVLLLGFGIVYPHFTSPWFRAIYASPVGVVPCPTLAVVAGYVLIAGGFGSRIVPAVLAAATAFYGVFGVLRLGVHLDVVLLAGTVGLLCLTGTAGARRADRALRSPLPGRHRSPRPRA